MRNAQAIQPYLDRIRTVPFVRKVEFSEKGREAGLGVAGTLKLRTPKGTQIFLVETRRSYLDAGLLHAVIAQARFFRDKQRKPLLLLARYIPSPSAERLIEAGINFVDEAGNMHLAVGESYERTTVGVKEKGHAERGHRLTPALTQLLLTFAAEKDAGSWTVRQLGQVSGLSKSNAAKLRKQLLDRGTPRQSRNRMEIADRSALEDQVLRGYETALRPKLLLGRFRPPESDFDAFLQKARDTFSQLSVRWSLTGGPAAYKLQRFYRGPDLALFISSLPDATRRRMRLIPDKSGPLIFLRSFGTLPFWKEVGGVMLAHPWLIYAELMCSADSRAHEAAREIKTQFLP